MSRAATTPVRGRTIACDCGGEGEIDSGDALRAVVARAAGGLLCAPPGCPIVDPPTVMERILNNFTMLYVVAGLGVAKEGVVATPKQVFVGDTATLAAGGDDANTGPVSLWFR